MIFHCFKRNLSRVVAKSLVGTTSYYITTPIFYVNSSPHIGHLYTIFLADALNVFHRQRLNTFDTLFSSGTDEHGIKIKNAAKANNMDCRRFCDLNSTKFRDLFSQFNISMTDFIRTTDERHERAVQAVWSRLLTKGYLYKNAYSGWYCSSDETFVPESQVSLKTDAQGVTYHEDINGNIVTWCSEENYLFRLSHFENDVLTWLSESRPIVPEKFNSEALSMLNRSTLGDISVSRPSSRLDWAVPVPDDPSQTIYVWLDALTSYLTVVGYPDDQDHLRRWPIDCQVIGKDILKFHAIYWPAFLMALSLPLPKKLICHSHWLVDSLKMSKSRGNVASPLEEKNLFTSDGLRYFLLRGATPHSDTDYNRTQALNRINSELADTYGNLLSRCCAPAINPNQHIPTKLIENPDSRIMDIMDRLNQLANICAIHYECGDFYRGVDEIMQVLRSTNALYEDTKPWKLVKNLASDTDSYRLHSNLQTVTFEVLRVCSILLLPIVPSIANAVLTKLSFDLRTWDSAKVSISFGDPTTTGRQVNRNTSSVIFKRLKEQENST